MIVLGIETSCDETSAAVVSDSHEILSQVLRTQIDQHSPWGGVIPEVGARAHLDFLDAVITQALEEAQVTLDDLDAIAVAAGPGLIGGVIVGVTMAKAISLAKNIPFLAVNHLAGHALTVRLTHDVPFPYLLLLMSGGHCQVVVVHSALEYTVLGETLDDAAGEAFDKVARLLGAPYPGGPHIEKLAQAGNAQAFRFPRPLLFKKEAALLCSFSFSGLKTAVRQAIEKAGSLTERQRADCAASFQEAVGEILANRMLNALEVCKKMNLNLTALVVAGGVASNAFLRGVLEEKASSKGIKFVAPPAILCTDNAAMIAWGGIEKMLLNQQDSLSFTPRPRWPLTELGRTFS